MKGESRSGVSQEANSAAVAVRVRLDLAALAQETRQPAEEFEVGGELLAAPAAEAEMANRASSVASKAGASRSSSGAG